MSLRSAKRRRSARAEKHSGLYVFTGSAPRIGDCDIRPGAFSAEQLSKFLNAQSEIVTATVLESNGPRPTLALDYRPGWQAVVRKAHAAGNASKEHLAMRYGLELADVEKALAGGDE